MFLFVILINRKILKIAFPTLVKWFAVRCFLENKHIQSWGRTFFNNIVQQISGLKNWSSHMHFLIKFNILNSNLKTQISYHVTFFCYYWYINIAEWTQISTIWLTNMFIYELFIAYFLVFDSYFKKMSGVPRFRF